MKNYDDYSDEELISLLRDGESSVTDYLMNKYKPLVRSKAKVMFLIGGETEDLLQEGMIGLFKALRDFRNDKDSSFFHFAEICVQRQLYKAVESSNRKKHGPLNNYISFSADEMEGSLEQLLYDERENPEYRVVEQEEVRQQLAYVFSHLSEMEKKVFRLQLNGYDYIQIAERLDKTPKSIDNALQRIRQKVRALNEGAGE